MSRRKQIDGGKTYEVTKGSCGDCAAVQYGHLCNDLCCGTDGVNDDECWREVPDETAQLKADNWSLLQQLQAAEARLDAAAVAMTEAAAGIDIVIAAAGHVGWLAMCVELRRNGERLRAARDKAKGIEPA